MITSIYGLADKRRTNQKKEIISQLAEYQRDVNLYLISFNANEYKIDDLIHDYQKEVARHIGEATQDINASINNWWPKSMYLYYAESLYDWFAVMTLLDNHDYRYDIVGSTDRPVYQIYFCDMSNVSYSIEE